MLAVDAEALSAGCEHTECVAAADGTGDHVSRGVEHVLGVVEDEEDVERARPLHVLDRRLALAGQAECGSNCVGDAGRLADLCELDESRPERTARRHDVRGLDRESRLSDSAGADQGHDARRLEHSGECFALVLATDERRSQCWWHDA